MALQDCPLNRNEKLRELEAHGTLAFPCAGYREHHTAQIQDTIPWHWHDELEIICVTEGTLRVQIPAEQYVLNAGDCLAINADILHSAGAEPSCVLDSLVFSPLLIAGSGDTVFARKYLAPLTACRAFRACRFDRERDSREIESFFSAFAAMEQEPAGFEFLVREGLAGICRSLYLRYLPHLESGGSAHSEDDSRIRRMLDFIGSHFAEELTVEQIAAAAGVGSRECLRCFQRTIQLAPGQYVQRYRMMRGAELLTETGKSISEIALDCGFDSPSYFSGMFRRSFGMTPREYRMKHLP